MTTKPLVTPDVSTSTPETRHSSASASQFATLSEPHVASGCLRGTRQSILATITAWLESPNKSLPRLLWLVDVAGSGKSTVARQIAISEAQKNQLLGSFFFSGDIESQSRASSLVSHLSRQIAESSGPIAAEISRAGPFRDEYYPEAFHSHITVPLCRHTPTKPSLIIIDALDQLGSLAERADFLSVLVEEMPLLPPTVKIMVTSKPSQDIDEALDRLQLSTRSMDDEVFGYYRLTFDIYGQANRSDLSKYISHSFQIVSQNKRLEGIPLPQSWPSSSQRASLTAHASGLPLWVSVAAAHMENSPKPHKALKELLALQHRPTPDAAMDTLYNHILRVAESSPDFDLQVYQTCFQAILSAKNPLTIHEINQETCLDVAPILAHLRPVLHCQQTIRVAHTSFAEYIQDPRKCEDRFLVPLGGANPLTPGTFPPPNLPHRWHAEVNHESVPISSHPHACLVPDVGYQIKEGSVSRYPITQGGFGDVWSADHIDGRKIAIKTLRLHGQLAVFDQHKLQRRIAKELAVWRKLEHPNVIKLLGRCTFNGGIGMVSEWMPNGNIIQYTTKYNQADKFKLITDVVDGLAYLHGKGIIHGDLKGSNIMIAVNGVARLVDFGLAKVAESTLKFSSTSAGKGCGTYGPKRKIKR
ncbi:unnamed protein product [Rhizoctonia solani]|uniref:Protein kinase domain-containing protein n=1 Tax=Rhizoctonia solani TaxID=456999 RepID=A0A8H3DWV1_9AGAM|nr:unnamed protein product [Rhizoctonia solani]